MKHLKSSALALALIGVASTSVMAQSSKTNAWEGAYAQIGAGYGTFSPKISNAVIHTGSSYGDVPASVSNIKDIGTGLVNLAVGYNFGINNNWMIGVGGTYYPGSSSGATADMSSALTGASTASYQVTKLYSIVLTPGYAIDSNRLVYAKVGYTGATIALSSPLIPFSKTNLNGYTFGLGYKQMLTSSFYAFGEVNHGTYGNVTASVTATAYNFPTNAQIKGSGTDYLVGIGYRF